MKKLYKFKNSSLLTIFFTYLSVVFTFLISFLRAKVLSPDEIGLISIFMSISSIAVVFISAGLPNGLTKFWAEAKNYNYQRELLIFNFVLITLLNIIGIILFIILKELFFKIYENSLFHKFYGYIIFINIGFVLNNLLNRLLEIEKYTILSVFSQKILPNLLNIIFLLLMIIFKFDFKYYLILFVSLYFVRLIIPIFFIKKNFNFKTYKNKGLESFREFLNWFNYKLFISFCGFTLISALTGTLTSVIDKLMIGNMINFKATGLYTIASSISIFILVLKSAIGRVNFPIISEYITNSQFERIKFLNYKYSNFLIFYGLFILWIFIFYNTEILNIFGKFYLKGKNILIFLGIGYFIQISESLTGGIILYSRFYKFDFYARTILFILAVITNLIFIPLYGVEGAAIATAISTTLFTILKVAFLKIKFKILPFTIKTLKVFILANIYIIITTEIFNGLFYKFNYDFTSYLKLICFFVINFIFYNLFGFKILKIKLLRETLNFIRKN